MIGAAIRDRNSRCVGHNDSSELRRHVHVRRGDDGQRFSAQYGNSLRDRVVRAEDDDPVPVLDGKDETQRPGVPPAALWKLRMGRGGQRQRRQWRPRVAVATTDTPDGESGMNRT